MGDFNEKEYHSVKTYLGIRALGLEILSRHPALQSNSASISIRLFKNEQPVSNSLLQIRKKLAETQGFLWKISARKQVL